MADTNWNGSTGDWTDSNQWDAGVPTSTTDAVIAAPGTYTVTIAAADNVVANSVTLDDSAATVQLFGTLTTDAVTVTAGALEIDGTVQNATIALAGGTVTFGASAIANFSAVAWTGGALDLGAGSAELLVTNGLTVQGANGAAGTVDLEGSFSTLAVEDTETLSAMTINIGSATGDDALSADGTLTLDTTTTVNLLAGADFAELGGLGALINDGTINAAATDGIINANEFTNAGALVVDNGGTLAVQPGDVFTNSGTVTVDAGGTLDIQYLNGFANSGAVIIDNGGFLELGATALSGGGTLDVFGTLDGSGQTLSIGTAGVAKTVEIDGTVQNATIALAGGTVTFGASAIANFSAVAWTGGALDLGAGSAELLVTNGLTVQGAGGAAGTVDLEGSFSTLAVEDTETLSAMTINIGSATGDDALSADGTLTLDTTTTVNLLAGADFAELGGLGALINDGTINAAATDGIINANEFTNAGALVVDNGGTLAVQPGDVFTNSGTVTVDAGGTLDIQYLNGFANSGAVIIDNGGFLELGATALSGGGTLDVFGTLDGSGQTLSIGTAGVAKTVEIDGTVQNATIALAGGTVTFGASAIANFSAVAWTGGALDLGAGSAELLVTNGLTVQGAGGAAGTVDLEGSFSTLAVEDTETLSAMTINIGSATGDDALSADGTLTLDTTTTVNLLAGADFAELGGLGALINDGTINAAATDGIINANEFTNAGALVVDNGGTLAVQPGDVFTNSGTVTVDAGGTLDIQYLNGFANSGAVIIDNGGFLELGATALSGGGTLDVFGTLDGSGQTLSIGTAGVAKTVEIDGTVQNATIALAGGTVTFGASAIANFSAVAWTGGALDLGAGSAELLVTNGLTVQGAGGAAGTVDLEGSFSTLAVEDTETLSAMTINIGSATGDDALSADGTLTLDTTTTVNLLAGADFAELGGLGALINDGTINAAATDGIINANEFTNAGALVVDNGGTLAVQPGDVFTNSGTVTVDAGGTLDIQYLNGFANSGAVTDLGGVIEIGATVTGSGLISLSNGSVVELQAGATGGTISFASSTDTLKLDTADFGDTLQGFATAGVLDLTSLGFTSGATATVAGTTLTVTDGGTMETFTLANAPGDTTKFYVYADGAGGTDISSIPCYCPGTLIQTVSGERPIEDLVIGDQVVTLAGEARPIRWIGRRGYTGRFAARNPDVLPVLIHAGALEDGVPKRDLMVSPLHAMFIDGLLIPASALVNGHSIATVKAVEQVEYIHLELDSHDVILAEGAPAESFVDDGSRGMFHNVAEYHSMHPDAVPAAPHYCAPRIEDGDALEAIRRRIAARATPKQQQGLGQLVGRLDIVAEDRIIGWAYDAADPNTPVRLRILADGVVIGQAVAELYRPDLAKADIGNGCYGFEFIVAGGLSPLTRHVVRVQRVDDVQDIPGSPFMIEATRIAPADHRSATAIWQGALDVTTRERVTGWAWDAAHPDHPVALQILDNGVPVGRVLANQFRSDLRRAGIGEGRHGFDLALPGGLSPLGRHVISVRFEQDGSELPGSPTVIERADSFDDGLEAAVAGAVSALAGSVVQDRVLSFMAAQLQRLQQLHADADGRRTERRVFEQVKRRGGVQIDGEAIAVAEPGLRALVIDTRTPVAGRDAGSVAVLSHMRALQHLGYDVSFVAADEMVPSNRADLDAIGVSIACAPYYNSVEDVLRRQAGCFDLVYLHRAPVAAAYLALARSHQPRARLIYNVADLHHVRLARQAAIEDRPELLAMSQKLRVSECTAAWLADAVITHSIQEAESLRRSVPAAEIHAVAWDVPLRTKRVPFADRSGLAFIGGYGHAPNVDAAHWLVETVMPLVWQIDPAIECRLIGSEMPRSVRALARPGVVIVGQVADLGAEFDRVRLTVAPLRFGAGVKGKVVESFAAGVPCVMTPVAAEGLALCKALEGLVGSDEAALAALIARLHARPAQHARMAKAGVALVRTAFSEAAIRAALQDAVEGRPYATSLQAAQ